MDDLLKHILLARVYDVAERTPLDLAENLSAATGNAVLLKREDLQPCFSFKVRGAYNKISHLTGKETARGVICASAGNHGQGVALAAQRLGRERWYLHYTLRIALVERAYSGPEGRARD